MLFFSKLPKPVNLLHRVVGFEFACSKYIRCNGNMFYIHFLPAEVVSWVLGDRCKQTEASLDKILTYISEFTPHTGTHRLQLSTQWTTWRNTE